MLFLSVLVSFFARARDAVALQPLDDFVASSRVKNPDNRAMGAIVDQRNAEVDTARGRYLPSLTAQGLYGHNQYELELSFPFPNAPSYLLVPKNQVDGLFTVAVPLIQIAGWRAKDAAEAAVRASDASRANTELSIERAVTSDYYTLIASESVLTLAEQSLLVSEQNRKLVDDRNQAGLASELDLQRATADVARTKQDIASAERSVILLRRHLETLSGIAPEPAQSPIEDDLHEEAPLDVWMKRSSGGDLIAVRSAILERVAAEQAAEAANAGWYPTIAGQAQERVTNATGFLGNHSSAYFVGISASWKIDYTLNPAVREKVAAAAAARAAEDKSRRAAEDAVYQAWQDVKAGIAQAQAARARVTAARLALKAARDRYTAGNATQLEVVQSQQDAFSADVARVQADASLQFSRAELRLSTRTNTEDRAR
jgi:outer membrane protein